MFAKQWTIISCGIDIKISQKFFGKSINISQFFIYYINIIYKIKFFNRKEIKMSFEKYLKTVL